MRKQANDPFYRLDVVTTDNWPQMEWGRLRDLAPQWHVHVLDTTGGAPVDVAAAVLRWIGDVLAGRAAYIRPGLTQR